METALRPLRLAKTEQAGQRHDPAPVRLADRIANIRGCWRTPDRRISVYRNEDPRFGRLGLPAAPFLPHGSCATAPNLTSGDFHGHTL